MTQENKDNISRSNKKKTKNKGRNILITTLLSILILTLIGTGVIAGLVFGAIKDAPDIDGANIEDLLNQNTFIFDKEGNVLEKVLAEENRTAESLANMPDYLQKAFISIEDERFYKHIGIDFRGIAAALVDDIKAGAKVRGASTITQQLARNLYLDKEKKLTRKIREAYIAIKLEGQLSKDQILEAYLNKIYLGQGAYGVKEAAHTYFSKDDLKDLTIAESALIAGITQSPTHLSPYITVKPQDVTEGSIVVGNVEVLGENYSAVYNPSCVERQKIILAKMKELGHISETEYQEALSEDISAALKPGKKKFSDISSYFVDYVKEQVVEDLVEKLNMTKEEAQHELLTGGLRIYSTVDLALQKDIENMYADFSNIVFGGRKGSSWNTDGAGNVVDSSNNIIYYQKSNMLNDNGDLIIENGTYTLNDSNLTIKNPKLNLYSKSVGINSYYTLNNGILTTHNLSSLSLNQEDFFVNENKELVISSSFFNGKTDFFQVDGNRNLIISSNYFANDTTGVPQPQSSTVIVDHSNGEIKALVGGRNFEGSGILNRALIPRQPGSAIKPLAAYLPALDNGYTAGSPVDDVPVMRNGSPWPRNSYSGYRGIISIREAIRDSSNAASVRMVESVGIPTSKEYLKRLGIIKDTGTDSFVTRLENKSHNDENSSALGLGGMTQGISPLEMTGAYAAIANNGTYIKPISYTKIEDRYGNIILENKPTKTKVVSAGIANVMTNMLKDVVTSGTGNRASVSGVEVAGKTGTTSDNTDAWFVGYSPNYAASVWIGNDSPSIKLPNGSALSAQFWSKIMKRVHEGVPKKSFSESSDLVKVSVCTISGKLPTSLCNGDPRHVVRTEVFARGTEPKESCDIHVSARIDVTTGKLASDNCPSGLVANRVFMKIEPAYIPSNFGGVIPNDYEYRLPTEYCNHQYAPPLIPDITDDDSDNDEVEDEEQDSSIKDKVDNIIDNILNPNNNNQNNNNNNGGNNSNNNGNNNNNSNQNGNNAEDTTTPTE